MPPPQWANIIPTSSGAAGARVKALATTNATLVKGSAGVVLGWYLYNTSAAAKFLKFYNKATAPVVGTDVPLFTVGLPTGGGTVIEWYNTIAFGAGIAYAITGAVADSDTTPTAADDVHGVILYA
jgi:hypothetical protein